MKGQSSGLSLMGSVHGVFRSVRPGQVSCTRSELVWGYVGGVGP